MGIRYYAYAFDSDKTDEALADPRAFIASDPLADAWGFAPHARIATVTLEQAVPERDMLYLDKAWRFLQMVTGPMTAEGTARPAYAMFQGDVTMSDDGWTPWCRALTPAQVADVARDLADLEDRTAALLLRRSGATDDDVSYALQFLARSRVYTEGLVADGRGMAYMIG